MMPGGELAGGSHIRRTVSNNNDRSGPAPRPLRRVESIGKGDPRRSSRYHPNNRSSRIPSMMMPEEDEYASMPAHNGGYRDGLPATSGNGLLPTSHNGGGGGWNDGRHSPYGGSSNGSSSPLGPLGPNDPMLSMQQQQQQHLAGVNGGGVRMMQYGAGFGAPMPRPGMATTQISSPSSFAQAAPLGGGLGRGMEASHATTRQLM